MHLSGVICNYFKWPLKCLSMCECVFYIAESVYNAPSVSGTRSASSSKPPRKKPDKNPDHRPYICMMCPARFVSATYLRSHTKRHDDSDPAGDHVHKQYRLTITALSWLTLCRSCNNRLLLGRPAGTTVPDGLMFCP